MTNHPLDGPLPEPTETSSANTEPDFEAMCSLGFQIRVWGLGFSLLLGASILIPFKGRGFIDQVSGLGFMAICDLWFKV